MPLETPAPAAGTWPATTDTVPLLLSRLKLAPSNTAAATRAEQCLVVAAQLIDRHIDSAVAYVASPADIEALLQLAEHLYRRDDVSVTDGVALDAFGVSEDAIDVVSSLLYKRRFGVA